MSSTKSKIIYNSAYQVLIMLIPLVTTPYISRILHPEGVGEYSYALSIATYFSIIAMLGLNNYGNRSIAICRDNIMERSRTFSSIYTMQLLTTILVCFAYSLLLIWTGYNKIRWIFFIYVISSVFDINWFFFGLEKFKLTVSRNAAVKLISTISIFLFVRTEEDANTYAFITALSFLLSHILLWPHLKKELVWVKPNINDVLKHIKPNLVLFIPVVAISIYKVIDKILLGILSNNTQVGYFDSSEKIIQIPMALIVALGTVMLPKISNIITHGDTDKEYYYIKVSMFFAMFISSLLCFLIMGVSNEFIPLFYGKGFETCIILYQILLPSCLFLAIANVVRTQVLIPRQQDKIYVVSVIMGAIVNILLNLLLIPSYKAMGASIATLIAEAVVCITQLYSLKRDKRICTYVKNSIFFLLPGFLTYILLINIELSSNLFYNLIFKLLIGLFLYTLISLPLLSRTLKMYTLKEK